MIKTVVDFGILFGASVSENLPTCNWGSESLVSSWRCCLARLRRCSLAGGVWSLGFLLLSARNSRRGSQLPVVIPCPSSPPHPCHACCLPPCLCSAITESFSSGIVNPHTLILRVSWFITATEHSVTCLPYFPQCSVYTRTILIVSNPVWGTYFEICVCVCLCVCMCVLARAP